MSAEHMPGKLWLGPKGTLLDYDGLDVAVCRLRPDAETRDANAYRLWAAWNFVVGTNTEYLLGTTLDRVLSMSGVEKLRRERDAAIVSRDALLAACKAAIPVLECAVRAGLEGFSAEDEAHVLANHGTLKQLREAVAKGVK